MKTNWIALKKGSLLPVIVAAVTTLTIISCEEDPLLINEENTVPEAQYSGNILDATFSVNPEGNVVELFNGLISLEFPEGAVTEPTEFTMVSFPLHHLDLDGHNLYNRGFSLTGDLMDSRFISSIRIRVRFDLAEKNWLKSVPVNPEELNIYNISPFGCAIKRVTSIGDCCTDLSCNMVSGCISQCGSYVVGEN